PSPRRPARDRSTAQTRIGKTFRRALLFLQERRVTAAHPIVQEPAVARWQGPCSTPRRRDRTMRVASRIALSILNGADRCTPAANWLGARLVRFADWVEDRRTRLAILATSAD